MNEMLASSPPPQHHGRSSCYRSSVTVLRAPVAVTCVAVCPLADDGGSNSSKDILFSGSQDGSIRIWEDGRASAVLWGHECDVVCLAAAVVSTESYIVLFSSGQDLKVRVWNVESRQLLQTLSVPTVVRSLAPASNGISLYTGGEESHVGQWNMAAGSRLVEPHDRPPLKRTNRFVSSLVLLSRGLHAKATDLLYSIEKEDHDDDLSSNSSLLLLKDGRILLCSHRDCRVRVHDATSLEPVEGDWLLGSEAGIRLWDVQSRSCISVIFAENPRCLRALALSPNGNTILLGAATRRHSRGWDCNTIYLWDVPSRECIGTLQGHSDGVTSVVYADTNGGDYIIVSGSRDGTLRRWNLDVGPTSTKLQAHSAAISSLALSSSTSSVEGNNPPTLFSASWDASIRQWEMQSGIEEKEETTRSPTATLDGHKDAILAVAVSPSGSLLASASKDNTVRVWDIATHTCKTTLRESEDSKRKQRARDSGSNTARLVGENSMNCICSVAFAHDDDTIITGHSSGVLSVWRRNRQQTGRLLFPRSRRINSHDNNNLSYSCNSVLHRHRADVLSLEITTAKTATSHSHARKPFLFSASADSTIQVWSIRTTTTTHAIRHVRVLLDEHGMGHASTVACLALSPSHDILASGSSDMTIRLWKTDALRLLAILRQEDEEWGGNPVTSLAIHQRETKARLDNDGHRDGYGDDDYDVDMNVVDDDWDDSVDDDDDDDDNCDDDDQSREGGDKYDNDQVMILSAGRDGSIRVWHMDTSTAAAPTQPTTILDSQFQSEIRSMLLTSDGDHLVAAAANGTVGSWFLSSLIQRETGERLHPSYRTLPLSPIVVNDLFLQGLRNVPQHNGEETYDWPEFQSIHPDLLRYALSSDFIDLSSTTTLISSAEKTQLFVPGEATRVNPLQFAVRKGAAAFLRKMLVIAPWQVLRGVHHAAADVHDDVGAATSSLSSLLLLEARRRNFVECIHVIVETFFVHLMTGKNHVIDWKGGGAMGEFLSPEAFLQEVDSFCLSLLDLKRIQNVLTTRSRKAGEKKEEEEEDEDEEEGGGGGGIIPWRQLVHAEGKEAKIVCQWCLDKMPILASEALVAAFHHPQKNQRVRCTLQYLDLALQDGMNRSKTGDLLRKTYADGGGRTSTWWQMVRTAEFEQVALAIAQHIPTLASEALVTAFHSNGDNRHQSQLYVERFLDAALQRRESSHTEELLLQPFTDEEGGTTTTWHQMVAMKDFAGIVFRIAQAFPSIHMKKDPNRWTAYSLAEPSCRHQINRAVLFCGKLQLDEELHRSKTSTIWSAKQVTATGSRVQSPLRTNKDDEPSSSGGEDTDEQVQPVVVKFMSCENLYRKEIAKRKDLDDRYIVQVHGKSEEFDDWEDEQVKKLELKGGPYPFGIIMPAAGRNLMVALLHEFTTFDEVCEMQHQLAEALYHLHCQDRIHGDFKPLNLVRMHDNTWRLIDFGATVSINSPIEAEKMSSAYCPPEMTTTIAEKNGQVDAKAVKALMTSAEAFESRQACSTTELGDIVVRRSKWDDWHGDLLRDGILAANIDRGYALIGAEPSFDVWSYGVVLYRTLTRKPLFESDASDMLTSALELKRLHSWNLRDVEVAMEEVENALLQSDVGLVVKDAGTRAAAAELVGWLLQPDPRARPLSFSDVMGHAFFETRSIGRSRKSNDWRLRMSQLHFAAFSGGTTNFTSAADGIGASDDINSTSHILGKTPLQLAAEAGRVEVVETMLRHDCCDPSIKDFVGLPVGHSVINKIERAAARRDHPAVKDLTKVIEIIMKLRESAFKETTEDGGISGHELGRNCKVKDVQNLFRCHPMPC